VRNEGGYLEVRRNLPPGNRVLTTAVEVVDVLEPALRRFAAIVGETEPLGTTARPVTLQIDDIWNEKHLPLPFHSLDAGDLFSLRDEPEFSRLLSFLWNRRVFKKTLIGSDPDRSSWEEWVLSELVQTPVYRCAESHYLAQLAELGEVKQPLVPDAMITTAAEVTAEEIVANRKLYRAECILSKVEADPGASWAISDEVRLQVLTDPEVAGFLTRHGASIQTEGALFRPVALLRIDGAIGDTELREPRTEERMHGPFLDEILSRLDVAKLALMVAMEITQPLTESSIFYTHRLGGRLGALVLPPYRRQQASTAPVYHLTDTVMTTACKRFEAIASAKANHRGLEDAMWLWGRSATSLLSRDRLLDAVIGMESLLVLTSGSSTYKLSLHGAAVLADSDEDTNRIARDLRNLYSLRSRAVHDTPRLGSTQESIDALSLFTKLIDRLAMLDDEGMLDHGPPISESIQKHVLINSRIARKT